MLRKAKTAPVVVNPSFGGILYCKSLSLESVLSEPVFVESLKLNMFGDYFSSYSYPKPMYVFIFIYLFKLT